MSEPATDSKAEKKTTKPQAEEKETVGSAIDKILGKSITKKKSTALKEVPGKSLVGTVVGKLNEPSTSKKLKTVFHEMPDDLFVSGPVKGPDLIKDFQELGVNSLPLPRDPQMREEDIKRRVKEFIGDISDEDFKKLDERMSKDIMYNGVRVNHPSLLSDEDTLKTFTKLPLDSKLMTHKALMGNFEKKYRVQYKPLLKYRGDKLAMMRSFKWMTAMGTDDLEPGKTVLYYVRVYRPYQGIMSKDQLSMKKPHFYPIISQQEIIFHGKQLLSELRDYIKCSNDYGPRHDVSEQPDENYIEYLKDVFPSGCLFINDVFYNDMRNEKCIDYSEPIRKWAKEKRIADLAAVDMKGVTFDSIEIKLGHPEVYIHQGNCEHLFTFSQVRLLDPSDVCVSSFYPDNSSLTKFKSILCNMCGMFTAQWAVVGSDRIPFEPAYMCSTCFKQYNYIDNEKVGDFKAYRNFDKNSALM